MKTKMVLSAREVLANGPEQMKALRAARAEAQRKEDAEILRHASRLVHEGREVSQARAVALTRAAIRRYHAGLYHNRRDRIFHILERIIEQTKPRKGRELAADKDQT